MVAMNWEFLIGELRAAGWTQVRIAERVGCSQPTISEIASGSVGRRGPSFQIASALIELHREVCGATKPPEKAERAA